MLRAAPTSGVIARADRRTASGRRPDGRRGFTLIETALATIIVGVGVLAMVSAQAAFHKKNAWSTHASIATALANEFREMMWNLPRHDPVTGDRYWGPDAGESAFIGDFDDLDDFDGSASDGLIWSAAANNGPVNARREIIPNMDGWSQTVRVFNVDPFHIVYNPGDYSSLPADGTTDYMVVEVIVEYQAPHAEAPEEMTRVSWLARN